MHLALPQISEPLKLWEKIEIVVADGDDKGLYLARIEDFIDDGIVISNPEFREGNTLLHDNCEVVVLVIKEDAVYQFYSLLSKKDSGDKPIFVLTLPREIRRVQRRQFVRIEVVSNIKVANMGARDVTKRPSWKDTVCMNISGGGMLIKSILDLDAPDLLLIKSDIFSQLDIPQPVAAICRRSYLRDNQNHTGIEFIRGDSLTHYFYEQEAKHLPETVAQFDHKTQNKLVTYVFQQQIELRKKGLI